MIKEIINYLLIFFYFIGTSYLPKFQKRAVTNLRNYSTKNDENSRKPKEGH